MADDEHFKRLPLRYEVAQIGADWAVFIVYDAHPEWWRKIASFASKERAESYACIENDIAGEWSGAMADDMQPPPAAVLALPAPASAIQPDRRRGARGGPVLPEEIARREQALLAAICGASAPLKIAALAEAAAMPVGSVHAYLHRLEDSGQIEKAENGWYRVLGDPRQPSEASDATPAGKFTNQTHVAGLRSPVPVPAAEVCDTQPLKFLGTDAAEPDGAVYVDDVMNDARREGDSVKPANGPDFTRFSINGGAAMVDREGLLTRANRCRIDAGIPQIEYEAVKWKSRPRR